MFFEKLFAIIRQKSVRFQIGEHGNLLVIEQDITVNFGNLKRDFCIYRNGITYRAEFLYKSYCLDHILFTSGDIIIDCGANYGDLFLALSPYLELADNYIAFEPSPDDFNILCSNLGRKGKILF